MKVISTLIFFDAVMLCVGKGNYEHFDPPCGENERFTECASSTCFEETCDEIRHPTSKPKRCTKDCRKGCQCKPGFYRNFDGRCVGEMSCLMCGSGEEWIDCGRGSCEADEYDLTCDIVVNDSGGVVAINSSGCKCAKDFYRSFESLCVSRPACEFCGANEEWEPCGSSSCWEFTCEDTELPISKRWRRPCTLDCRKGCRCHEGFFRDKETDMCVPASSCK